jgi:hypothetical protein
VTPVRSCLRTLLVHCALVWPVVPLIVPLAAAAQANAAGEDGARWRELSPAQRSALAPLEREWASIDGPRKQKWLEIAGRFPAMPAAERTRLQERMADWARMTPAQRGQARLNFQQSREVPSDDRRARWEAYQSLPSEERKQLAARAAAPPGGAQSRRGTPVPEVAPTKSNIVPNPALAAPPRAVAPTVVQAKPGATTSLMSDRRAPPSHQQTGLPKIAATPGFVDKQTLLPQRGPQGAAVVPPRGDADAAQAPKKPAR